MSFVLWYIILEDVVLLAAICALIYAKQRLYTLVAVITLVILAFTTILLIHGIRDYLLSIIPIAAFIFMNLMIRPFVPRTRKILSTRVARIIVIILFSLTILVIIAGILLSIFVFTGKL
jgi:hypothetical protein